MKLTTGGRAASDNRTGGELGSEGEQIRLILDNIPAFVIVLGADGSIESANTQTFKYLGVSFKELKDWANGSFIHPDDFTSTLEKFAVSLGKAQEFENELRLLRNDGVYRWFHSRALPIKNLSGEILNWYVLLTDVDQMKQSERLLLEREREMSSMVESIPALVGVLSADGQIEFLNKAILDYFGRSVQDLNEWAMNDTVHPEDLPATTELIAKAFSAGTPYDIEERLRRFDGVYRWFNARGHPMKDAAGRILRWYFLLIDIDDKKRAEVDLKAREQDLRRMEAFNAEGQMLSKTGTFYWNTATDERLYSDELCRIAEIELGTHISEDLMTSRIHPDDRNLLKQKVENGQEGRGGLDYEIRLKLPSGKVKWIHTIARGYEIENGGYEYVGASQDITDRHNFEEALGKLRAELAHMARVTSLGALTASIAHEVNQPLAGILTNASTGLRMLSSNPPNVIGALETGRRTIRDANRASDVIARLRAMFSKRETINEIVHLNEAAKEVIALSLTELQRNKLIILTEFAEGLPHVLGDRVQLQQVILNLLLNASDAMKEVSERAREIRVKTMLDGPDAVKLSVHDLGIGINPESMQQLFEPFYTTKSSGMGIGLSVSRGIIERHGGRLWAEKNEAHGASFSFSIPLKAEGAASQSNISI